MTYQAEARIDFNFHTKINDMFGLRLTSEKYISGLESELKGYYADEQRRNERNEYMKALTAVVRGLELPPFTPVNRQELKALYERSSPVMGVVNYIAENVGEVMRYLELKDMRTGEYVDRHWLLDLIRRPNDRFTLRKFGTAWAINKLIYGDTFVYAPKSVGRDYGKVAEMYVIPSHRVGVMHGDDSNPFAGIKLVGLSGDRLITPEEVFESFDYNLDDTSWFGTSRLASAATYLSVMEKGMAREESALKNGGVANVITPQPDKQVGVARPTEADSLEKEFNAQSAVGKTKVLRYPVEIHTLGNAPVDLSILESHKEAVTALCFVYKLPVDLYYGQAKYENAKEAKKTIYEQNAIPMANEFAEDLLNYCGLSGDYELAVNTDRIDVLKRDPMDTLNALDKMCATLNEKREAMGYERIDEAYADKPMISMGYQFGSEYDDIDTELL